ncbi:MAG: hypothetical protein ACF8R7_17845 [Phycisphaerales bacterium JB039]
MTEIQRVLRTAARRLLVIDLLRTFAVTSTVALGLLLLARIVTWVLSTPVDWAPVTLGLAAAAVVTSVIWSLARRARGLDLAREVDERGDLREALSTAVWVGDRPDGWAKIVVEMARKKAASLNVREVTPIEAPRLWPAPVAMAMALAVVWVALPGKGLDLLGMLAAKEQEQAREQQLQQAKIEAKTAEDLVRDIARQANLEVKDDPGEPNDGVKPNETDPDALLRGAMKKLTDLKDQLKSSEEQTKSRLDAAKEQMRKLKQPGPGPLDNFARQLQRGDFKAAQEALKEAQEKLESGDLGEAEKEQLKEQLENLGQQLQKLAEQRAELEKTLQDAGMSAEEAKKAAGMTPEQLQQAIQNMQNLTEEQKQQLQEMAEAAQQASETCSGMGSQMMQMAQAMGSGQGQQGQPGEGMEGLAGMLSSMEMMEAELDGLSAAMQSAEMQMASLSQCMGGGPPSPYGDPNRISPWKAGENKSMGWGSGGPGRSQGGANVEGNDADATQRKVRETTRLKSGQIVGERLVYGSQIRGESRAQFGEAAVAARSAAAEEVQSGVIPKEYHEAVQRYFGRLEKLAEIERGAGDPAAEESGGSGGGN